MTVWTLNGRFNFVDHGDVVLIAPDQDRWTITRKGELRASGRRGDTATVILSSLPPGGVVWVDDPQSSRSTYCMKYPPDVIGDIADVECFAAAEI